MIDTSTSTFNWPQFVPVRTVYFDRCGPDWQRMEQIELPLMLRELENQL